MEKVKIRWEGPGWYYCDPSRFPKERVLLYHSRLDNPRIWAAPHFVIGIQAGEDGEPEAAGWEFEKV